MHNLPQYYDVAFLKLKLFRLSNRITAIGVNLLSC